MRDQAEALRRMRADFAAPAAPPAGAAFAIGSGKGGVGKSVLSVLVAAELARAGKSVLLLDGAQNQGNLHVLLGVRPGASLASLVRGDAEPEALVVPVAERLSLVPADCGAEALYALGTLDRARLHHRLSALYDRFDAVIVDAGAGIESVVRATIRAARLVVVATPEPAALSDAYALIKIATQQVPSVPVDVLVNRALDQAEADAAAARLDLAASRFLRRALGDLGWVPEEGSLRAAVRAPGRLLEPIDGPTGEAIARIARTLAASVATPEHAS